MNKDMSMRHYYAGRSIPTSRENVIIPLDKPSYISKLDGGHWAAIFNGEGRNKFYFNGLPTSQWINEGDSISVWKTFEEGYEHSYDFMLLDMGYIYGDPGFKASIKKFNSVNCYLYTDGNPCTASSAYEARTTGHVGTLTYIWEAYGAELVEGQGEIKASFRSTGYTNNIFTIKLTVSDAYTTTVVTFQDTHLRSESGDKPLFPSKILYPSKYIYPGYE